MGCQSEIKKKINSLIGLMLNKGVTPEELMTNIYNEEYSEIRSIRQGEYIHCSVVFYDTDYFSDSPLRVEYKYIYDRDMYLQEITSCSKRSITILWSRANEEEKLIQDILNLMQTQNDKNYVNAFLLSLPNELFDRVSRFFENVS